MATKKRLIRILKKRKKEESLEVEVETIDRILEHLKDGNLTDKEIDFYFRLYGA